MAGEIQARTVSVRKWKIRVRGVDAEPVELDSTELIDKQDIQDVFERAMQQVMRASYVVNGPNREILWSISLWRRGEWQLVQEGKSKLKDQSLTRKNRFGLEVREHPIP